MKKQIFNINDRNWEENLRQITTGVFGRKLIPSDETTIKITETKVEPGGIFRPHIDSYHHVLYFIEGIGIGWIGDEPYDIKPGVVVNIPAGEKQAYKNSGTEQMKLLTINFPKS